MIKGTTKNLGVIGWPITHSLSPVLQNAAIDRLGFDYAYIALPVAPLDLKAAVQGLRALHFAGWNVTIPHKETIMSLLDEIDENAKRIGAVNTVVNRDGCLYGYNTDAEGFLDALRIRHYKLAGTNSVMLGAGGAARAILWALLKEQSSVSIGVRSPQKAQVLADRFQDYGRIRIFHWETSEFRAKMRKADLLVNTTPLGMRPHDEVMPPVDWSVLNPSAIVYDIIYIPAETRLLREAHEHGHQTINGERMLAAQGAAAFRLWMGAAPDLPYMEEQIRAALSESY